MSARLLVVTAAVLLCVAGAAQATDFRSPPLPDDIPFTGPAVTPPDVALSDAGDAVAVWTDETGDDVDAAYRPAGGAWTALPIVAENTGTTADRMDVQMDAAGNATALWQLAGNGVLRTAYRPAGTGAFGPSSAVSPPSVESYSFVVAPDGRAVIAYVTPDDRVRALVREPGETAFYDSPGGDTLPDQLLVSADTAVVRRGTSSAITSTGRTIVVWEDENDTAIRAAIREPGVLDFANEHDVATPAGTGAVRPNVATDGLGGAVVSYSETLNANPDAVLRASRSANPGPGNWEAPLSVSATEQLVGSLPQRLAMTPDGEAFVLWERPNGELRVARQQPGGVWTPNPGGEVVAAGNIDMFELAAGPNDNVLASWRDTTDTSAKVREVSAPLQPGTTRTVSAAGDSVVDPEVAIDADGDALVTWRDFTAPVRLRAELGDAAAPAAALTGPASLFTAETGQWTMTSSDFSGVQPAAFTFSDGFASTGDTVTHAFAPPGTHTVSAEVRDLFGKATTRALQVDVAPRVGLPGPECCAPPPPPPNNPVRTQRPDTNIVPPGRRVRARRLHRLRGTASDQFGVARVEVAVVRLRGGARFLATTAARRCQSLTASGRLRRQRIRRGRCSVTGYLRATGTTSWTFRFPRRLPRGSYVAVSRAFGVDGAVERGFSAADRNLVRFRVVR